MDAIGIMQPVVTTAQLLPVPSMGQGSASAASVLPAASSGASADSNPQQVIASGFDAQAAEQRRLEAVQRAAQDIANVFIVSDKTFSIFKDVTGQYITRFTSLRDGKVTYIPEPELFRISGGDPVGEKPLFQIKA